MHATIQKPIDEIVRFIRPGEKVFVVGCNNCAWKCHSGGEDETCRMAERLADRGVAVIGYTSIGQPFGHPTGFVFAAGVALPDRKSVV